MTRPPTRRGLPLAFRRVRRTPGAPGGGSTDRVPRPAAPAPTSQPPGSEPRAPAGGRRVCQTQRAKLRAGRQRAAGMAARKSPAQERERPREHASGGPRAGGAGSQERALLVGAAFGVGRPGTGGPRGGESRRGGEGNRLQGWGGRRRGASLSGGGKAGAGLEAASDQLRRRWPVPGQRERGLYLGCGVTGFGGASPAPTSGGVPSELSLSLGRCRREVDEFRALPAEDVVHTFAAVETR